jgi:pimeloyl-ACP methyl ester carboxylesterase
MAAKLDASIAVLNGLVGDYLARTRNGLATETEVFASASGGEPLRLEADALRAALPAAPSPRVVVLVHGLMCTEAIWRMPDGSDYGTRLAADLGYQPFYLRYNTGLSIHDSGASLARALGRLVAAYPGPVESIVAVGHSMGGLVVRAACHAGRTGEAPAALVARLRRAIYLGTPHLGAPLERVGRLVTRVLRAIPDPYTRLVADIADLRSRGMQDLGDGLRDARHPIPLLPEMEHYLVAASLADPWLAALFGDALVPVTSATAGHFDPSKAPLPPDHVRIVPRSGHIALARDAVVYEAIRAWCGGPPTPAEEEARP